MKDTKAALWDRLNGGKLRKQKIKEARTLAEKNYQERLGFIEQCPLAEYFGFYDNNSFI